MSKRRLPVKKEIWETNWYLDLGLSVYVAESENVKLDFCTFYQCYNTSKFFCSKETRDAYLNRNNFPYPGTKFREAGPALEYLDQLLTWDFYE